MKRMDIENILPKEFNLRNYDLASFICNTAIEIDNHIIKREDIKIRYDKIFRLVSQQNSRNYFL